MSMSNVKVSTRLSLGFGAILLIMLALTAIGIWRMQVISDVMVTMTQQDNLRLQETMRWRENTQKNWIRTRAMLLNADPQFNAIWEPEIAATSAAISEGQKKIESLLRLEEGTRLFKGLDSHRAAYRNLRTALMQQSASGDYVADRVESELKPLADAYDQALGQFADYQLKVYTETRETALAQVRQSQIMLASVAAITLLLGIWGAWALGRSITRPLHQAVGIADEIAHGNLTQSFTISGRDETATLLTSLHEMQAKLASIVAGVRQNADSAQQANQLALSATQVRALTTTQLGNLEAADIDHQRLGGPALGNIGEVEEILRHATARASPAPPPPRPRRFRRRAGRARPRPGRAIGRRGAARRPPPAPVQPLLLPRAAGWRQRSPDPASHGAPP